MKSKTFIRKSLKLTDPQWAALEQIAAETGSLARAGPRTGEPSWRRLLGRIAGGELRVVVVKKDE